jgi:hypothetical protein
VLRRRGAGPGADARVVQRLAGPGATGAAGSLPLAAVDRAALLGGALALAVVDTAGGVRETPLRVPAAARDTVGRPR